MTDNASNPAWWTTSDTTTWDRVKEAMRRDWNQTKHDFGSKFGENLNQDLTDTVRQAVGASPIPGPHVANDEEAWSDEAAVRYGYSAALAPNYRNHTTWGPELEAQLKSDWEAMGSGRTWDEVLPAVRYGWTRSPRIAS